MPNIDEDDESGHFRPDPWKVAWDATQDLCAPSCQVKAAAERLVWSELLQQTMGWLLLTQIGVLLGSFAQSMTQSVCLLSWGIFMLEAMLKFGRRWAHSHFFMDVPCAYVPIHKEAAHNSLALFGIYLMSGTLLELPLYGFYIYAVFGYWRKDKFCYTSDDIACQDGTTILIELLFFSGATAIIHWISSLVTVLTFHTAMGVWLPSLQKKQKSSFHGNLSNSCHCNQRGCKAGKIFSSPRTDFDRLLCLTWWVHKARHRHLSAVVASAQPGNCGLPGHWFDGVVQLKRIVRESVVSGAGDVSFDSAGPLWVSQEMALRALVSLAKQNVVETCGDILADNGFNLLVQVVREGKLSNCRGLAAAGIAVLATQHEAIRKERVDLTVAVVPLRRLARSTKSDLKEVAFGALLNLTLNDDQCVEILSKLQSSDGMVDGQTGPRGTFLATLIEHAQLGTTSRCQDLATGLLGRLAGNSKQVRIALITDNGASKLNGLELFTTLLQHGLTTEIKVSAAGVLTELAYKEGKVIGTGPHGHGCMKALLEGLRGEPRIVYACARALCNLAIKCDENKREIVSLGGIGAFVELLKGDDDMQQNNEFINRRDLLSQSQMQEQAQAEAARALWMLAFNHSANQELIAVAQAIPYLANLLCKSRPKVHIQAVAALTALAWKNERNQELIGQEGHRIFPRIVGLLGDIDYNMEDKETEKIDDEKMEEKVLEKVALAIMSFAAGSKANQEGLVSAGAKLQLEKIRQREDRIYKNDRALSRVGKAIEILNGK